MGVRSRRPGQNDCGPASDSLAGRVRTSDLRLQLCTDRSKAFFARGDVLTCVLKISVISLTRYSSYLYAETILAAMPPTLQTMLHLPLTNKPRERYLLANVVCDRNLPQPAGRPRYRLSVAAITVQCSAVGCVHRLGSHRIRMYLRGRGSEGHLRCLSTCETLQSTSGRKEGRKAPLCLPTDRPTES